MLVELHIAGLGVIDDVTLELAPGLNVLTGETGAGKTMVTVGLALVLGRRAQATLVRSGSARARVEARFEVPLDEELDGWAEDGELILAREIAADGRSGARAGGRVAPRSALERLGARLVEVHGQNQGQRLLGAAAQLAFLDRFAGEEHVRIVDRYRDGFAELDTARAALERLDAEAREREREKDLLAHQVAEIEAARLQPGETAELLAERNRLNHAERILSLLDGARTAVGGEGGAADALGLAAASLAEAAELHPELGDLARRLDGAAVEGRDAGDAIRRASEAVEVDPGRLDEVAERLAAIRGLERRYGDGEEGVLGYLKEARERLVALEGATGERARLAGHVERLTSETERLGKDLSEARSEAAPRLSAALDEELGELGMAGSMVEMRILRLAEAGPDGYERAELRFSGGPGQEAAPLARVASGGELSRAMLACRTVLADLDDVPVLVFDEVDAGVGGRAGLAVGRRLARLARRRQVLVVTHLPQIACFADRQFRVTKEAGTARVDVVDGAGRVEELARMLSGVPTDEAASHATQLLAEARRERVG